MPKRAGIALHVEERHYHTVVFQPCRQRRVSSRRVKSGTIGWALSVLGAVCEGSLRRERGEIPVMIEWEANGENGDCRIWKDKYTPKG